MNKKSQTGKAAQKPTKRSGIGMVNVYQSDMGRLQILRRQFGDSNTWDFLHRLLDMAESNLPKSKAAA